MLNTTKAAGKAALEFCNKNKGWVRICDLNVTLDSLFESWEELDEKTKSEWINSYDSEAEEAYYEFGTPKCKVPHLLIDSQGKTYENIKDMKKLLNTMVVFKMF